MNRLRMSEGINSAQYFNHCSRISELELKEVQSRMISNEQVRQVPDVRIYNISDEPSIMKRKS
jgi:hypothetical protein